MKFASLSYRLLLVGSLLGFSAPAWAHPGTGDLGGLAGNSGILGIPTLDFEEKPPVWDNFADYWVATDSTGKALPLGAEVGAPQKGKMAVVRWRAAKVDAISVLRMANTGADGVLFDGADPDFEAKALQYMLLARALRSNGNIVPGAVFSASDVAGVNAMWKVYNESDGADDIMTRDDKAVLIADEKALAPQLDDKMKKWLAWQSPADSDTFHILDTDLDDEDAYLATIAAIRRFKGARALPAPSAPVTIAIDGKFKEWKAVVPEYRDTLGEWNRNDIAAAKVARDATNFYFYVRARAALSPTSGAGWMQLWIDADQNPATGWHGYDYAVNWAIKDAKTLTIAQYDGTWKEIGMANYAINGNELEIAVPRALIGLQTRQNFDFHWTDGAVVDDSKNWLASGENAPDGHFDFRC